MLPKTRIFAALLVGLGAALVAWSIIAPLFLHVDARLPLDVGSTTTAVVDENATSKVVGSPVGRIVKGPVKRQVHVKLTDPVDKDTATVRVGITTMRLSEQEDAKRLIDASVWSYRIDRSTGLAVGDAKVSITPMFPPDQVAIDGVWLKFPAPVTSDSYSVFDGTTRASFPATKVEEKQMGGRKVVVLKQIVPVHDVAKIWDGPLTKTVIEGIPADLFHSVERTFTVDKLSGIIVAVHEKIDEYYETTVTPEKATTAEEIAAAAAPMRQVFLSFDGETPADQTKKLLAKAATIPTGVTFTALQILSGIMGVLFFIVGLIGVFTGFGSWRRGKKSGKNAG